MSDRDLEWATGPVDRSGLAQFTHLIRAKGDPKRSPREARRGKETAWRKLTDKATKGVWRAGILKLLADGVPRTFNRIGVELADMNADTLAGKAPDDALWELVEDGTIEHTIHAPILFRLKKVCSEPGPDGT